MRFFKFVAGILVLMGVFAFLTDKLLASKKPAQARSVYDFTVESLDGEQISLSRYKGKYILIVNTASKCGFTPQYEELQQLHEQYSDRVAVLGFPANNFLWQEPGSDEEIASFCQRNYGVTFQMFSKISVKGRHQHPLYSFLEAQTGKAPSWNFCKYLMDPHGKVLGFFPSKVRPMDREILDKIQL
jgi:glutathione peroxidase